jgi:uncharacterized protein (TIGR00369 family)
VSGGNAAHVQVMFERSDFIRSLGIKLTGVGDGWCEATFIPSERHRQQHGFIHAGVVYTLADHVAGGAAGTVLAPDKDVITVENKISYLRPAIGESLRCRGVVLRGGKNLIFAEAEVFATHKGEEKLVAKLISTLSVIPNQITG